MGPLPDVRVHTEPRQDAFSNVVMDAAGPFAVKAAARGSTRLKRWLLIICCTVTRAVHIEVLHDLSTDSLVLALESFVALRSKPKRILSDNQTSFRRLALELEAYDGESQVDHREVTRKAGIDFHFGPPMSPHFQGLAEAFVKQVKRALDTTLTSPFPTESELRTATLKIMGWLNDLPISYTVHSATDLDLDPLTPNHLLVLKGNYSYPWTNPKEGNVYQRKWRAVQQFVNQFWKRWLSEYLPELQRRQKWLNVMPNIRIGDVVLLIDENAPRGTWPLGRVCDVTSGRDGLVRSVRLVTKSGQLVRPITKVVLLESAYAKSQ